MIAVFNSLFTKEQPDYIIGSHSDAFESLFVVEKMYAKDGRFYCARSFYTDCWIAANPCAFLYETELQPCNTLADIADIIEFESLSACFRMRHLAQKDLQKLYHDLDSNLAIQLNRVLRTKCASLPTCSSYIRLALAPFPAISIRLFVDKSFLGSLLWDCRRQITVVMRCDKLIDEYARQLSIFMTEQCCEYTRGASALPGLELDTSL